MIRRIVRIFRVLLLLLAAVAFVGHMIIPHDHHLTDTDTLQEGKYTVPINSKNHHTGFPIHCHVFNDLASEKAVSYYFIRNTQGRDFEASCVFDIADANHLIYCLRFFNVIELPVDSFILELSSLRAPPSIC